MTEELIPMPGKGGDLLIQFRFKEIDGRWQWNESLP